MSRTVRTPAYATEHSSGIRAIRHLDRRGAGGFFLLSPKAIDDAFASRGNRYMRCHPPRMRQNKKTQG
jgi:hypothetical protein